MSDRGSEGWRAHDLRTVPLAAAAWTATAVATGEQVSWRSLVGAAVAVGALAVLVVLVARPRPAAARPPARPRPAAWLVATALVAAAAAAVSGLTLHRLRTGPVADLAARTATVRVSAVVSGDPHALPAQGGRPPLTLVRASVVSLSGRGGQWWVRAPVLLLVSGDARGWDRLPVGSRVDAAGRLQPARPGQDVAAVLRVTAPPTPVAPPDAGGRLVERVRQGLRDAVAGRRPDPRALVPALVLGDTSRLPTDLEDDFRSTGLTHLTAVSGANLTLLLAFLLLAARWLHVRGWALRGVGLAAVVVFVALCRPEPSVLRAAAMGLVALAALGSGSRRGGVRNLAVAVLLLLLLDPFLARSWGFGLSVLASAGILVWAGRWADLLGRWLPRLVAEAVALPLAAHLATLPAVAALSGTVSLSGLAANALAGPFVGPATVLGFAAASASLVSAPVAAVLGFGAAWCAQAVVGVARVGAGLPGGSVVWPPTPLALGLLAAGALTTALVLPVVLARRWLSLLLAALLTVLLARAPTQPGWPPLGWRFVVCDVGQGDGLVLRTAPHEAVVVDGGPDPALMRRCLDGLRVRRVPLLVLSHFHADHADGLPGVFTGRGVDRVWVSPLAEPTGEVAAVRRAASAGHAPVEVPPVGTRVRVGDVQLTVLGPLPPRGVDPDASAAQNDASLVLRADTPALRLLLPGDVEPPGQQALLAAGVDLRADVLKVPHHGSARQEAAFFAATHARLAVASAGARNDYGHPAPRTLALARSLGMTVLSTSTAGAVAVAEDAGRLRVVAQRAPPVVPGR